MKIYNSAGELCGVVPYYVEKHMDEWFVLRVYGEGTWGQGSKTESAARHVCKELNKAHKE